MSDNFTQTSPSPPNIYSLLYLLLHNPNKPSLCPVRVSTGLSESKGGSQLKGSSEWSDGDLSIVQNKNNGLELHIIKNHKRLYPKIEQKENSKIIIKLEPEKIKKDNNEEEKEIKEDKSKDDKAK